MRKDLTSFIRKKSTTEKDVSILIGVILIEVEEGIDLKITREKARVGPGSKVREESSESLALRNLDVEKAARIKNLIDDWLESESHPTLFETIENVDGGYEREEKGSMRRSPAPVHKEFKTLDFSVGERSIAFEFKSGEEWEGIDIPSAEQVNQGISQDFQNTLTLSHFFYDFFDKGFDGDVPGIEIEEPVSIERSAIDKIELIFERFGQIALQLSDRGQSKPALVMEDENDVQYLMHALLRLYFDDVRDEEYLKKHAGKSPRIDFLLESEKIGIEIKRLSATRKPDRIRKELSEDKEQYRADVLCDTLLCFIYDPERQLNNPASFENDITETTDNLTTRVTVNQG